MELLIDTTGVVRLADAFGANMRQMEAAEIRALNKTMKWLATHTVRVVSKEMKLAVKLVRQRIRAFKATRRKRYGRVWAGLQAIAAHRLGRVRQTKKGTRAGRHMFEGAFAHPTVKGKVTVFQRTGEPKRKMKSGRYAGQRREPIERVELDIDTEQVNKAIEAIYKQAQSRFFIALKQELNYQVVVKNA